MSETYCGLLNVLILSIVAGANGLLIARTRGLPEAVNRRRAGSDAVVGDDEG